MGKRRGAIIITNSPTGRQELEFFERISRQTRLKFENRKVHQKAKIKTNNQYVNIIQGPSETAHTAHPYINSLLLRLVYI
jgi:hypothetical protein